MLNWVMIGGGIGVVAGVVLAAVGLPLAWSSSVGGFLAYLGTAVAVAGAAAFLIGIGMAL